MAGLQRVIVGDARVFRRIWHDPVWSKVISGIILGGLGVVAAYLVSNVFAKWVRAVVGWCAQPIAIPLWLLLLLVLVTVVSVVSLAIGLRRSRQRLPVAETQRVAKPFVELSEQQKAYLRNQYMRGTRQFTEHTVTTRMRWFEEMCNWRYIEYVDVPMFALGGPSPFEITEQGWAELAAVL